MKTSKDDRGITIFEILAAISVIIIVFGTVAGFSVFALRSFLRSHKTVQAHNLASGQLEAVRFYRDNSDWHEDGLGEMVGNFYHFDKDEVSLKEGSGAINGFDIEIEILETRRDSFGNITYSGGEIDPDTVKVISRVFWEEEDLEIFIYLTDWQ